jgi:HSP20 family protein
MRGDWFAPSPWMENPFGLLRRFSEEMDRIFDEFGLGRGSRGGSFSRGREQEHGMWSPQVEMYERDNQLVICADLPGLKKEDIQLEINDNALVIHGERRHEFEDTQEGYRRSERSYGSFYRTIPLPEGMDTEQAKANFQDGVLKIMLPLPQEQKQRSRRIEVQGASLSSAAPRQEGGKSTSEQPTA